jgi:hypothetical protein
VHYDTEVGSSRQKTEARSPRSATFLTPLDQWTTAGAASILGVQVLLKSPVRHAALDEITRRHPELVLLDLQMPVMSGLDALSRQMGVKCVLLRGLMSRSQFEARGAKTGRRDGESCLAAERRSISGTLDA